MIIISLRNGQLLYIHMRMTARKQKVIAFTKMKDSLRHVPTPQLEPCSSVQPSENRYNLATTKRSKTAQ